MKITVTKIIPSLILASLFSLNAMADDGPRMYWNAPKDLNILQTYAISVHGNIDSEVAQTYNPDLVTDMNIMLMGYNRTVSVAGHTAILTAILTAGNASGLLELPNDTIQAESTRGIGDIYFQGTFNIFGGQSLSMEDFASYEQGTIVSFLIGLSTPTGQYDNKSALNMGANRWALRLGIPFVQTLGSWKAGSITTFEVLPSVWFYDANDDYGVASQKLTQDPLFNVEAHLTQDLSTTAYVSLDYVYQDSGETFVDGDSQGDAQGADSLGLSFGYQVNPQFQFMFRYSASLNPNENELSADMSQLDINYVW